jgi:Lsr2
VSHTLIIDLGEPFATVVIAVDHELDLSQQNMAALRNALKALLGRKLPAEPRRVRPAGTESAIVRKWAVANGYDLPEHGRIPNEIKEAYKERRKVTPLKEGSSSN